VWAGNCGFASLPHVPSPPHVPPPPPSIALARIPSQGENESPRGLGRDSTGGRWVSSPGPRSRGRESLGAHSAGETPRVRGAAESWGLGFGPGPAP
jgi:hypothetical protein